MRRQKELNTVLPRRNFGWNRERNTLVFHKDFRMSEQAKGQSEIKMELIKVHNKDCSGISKDIEIMWHCLGKF